MTYIERFDDGPGGWYSWDTNGGKRLEIRDSAAVSQSPWWVDYNHCQPGAGYLHILFALNTRNGKDTERIADQNRFAEGGHPTDFTNARVTVRIRGELDAKGASLLFHAQADIPGTRVNSVLSAQPISVTPNWSEQTIILVPDDRQWTSLGSCQDRTDTYGHGPIAPVLHDLNLDIIFVLFPLDVVPAVTIRGDPHQLRAGKDYLVNESRLPSGCVMLDEVRIDFR